MLFLTNNKLDYITQMHNEIEFLGFFLRLGSFFAAAR